MTNWFRSLWTKYKHVSVICEVCPRIWGPNPMLLDKIYNNQILYITHYKTPTIKDDEIVRWKLKNCIICRKCKKWQSLTEMEQLLVLWI